MTVVSPTAPPTGWWTTQRGAADRGVGVIVAGAGGAAHLPGMTASLTPLPVIGVPIKSRNSIDGWDSVLSILQMPSGVPVATVALDGGTNAGILAAKSSEPQTTPSARALPPSRKGSRTRSCRRFKTWKGTGQHDQLHPFRTDARKLHQCLLGGIAPRPIAFVSTQDGKDGVNPLHFLTSTCSRRTRRCWCFHPHVVAEMAAPSTQGQRPARARGGGELGRPRHGSRMFPREHRLCRGWMNCQTGLTPLASDGCRRHGWLRRRFSWSARW